MTSPTGPSASSIFEIYSAQQLVELLDQMSPEEQAEASPLIEDDACARWVLSHNAGRYCA